MPAKQRTKPPPQTTRDYLATLERAIRKLSYNQHLFTTFRHFVEVSAIAFSNVADPINKDAREAEYLAIVKQYTPETFKHFRISSACSSAVSNRRSPMCSACCTTASNCTTNKLASFSRPTRS